jgi:membrane-associated phospholipid phosphatase
VGKGGSGRAQNPLERGAALKPADKVAIAYLVVITLLVLVFSYRVPWWQAFCAGHAILIAFIVLIARSLPVSPSPPLPPSSRHRLLAPFIRGWYPVVLIPITYKELTYLIPRLHPRDFDEALAALDYRFLGVHPTVWLERFTYTLLTEVLQLTYSTYYFLPLVLGVVLWRRRSFEQFHFWVFIVVLGFYLSYLGYISVPVIGPRFLPTILEAQTKPLTGVWLFQSVRETLDRAEGITRDCFPSGHTALTLLVLYYARSFHRKVFWWLLPLGTGVIISTVYLRYHYVIDVVAGALLAVVIVLIAKPLYRLLGGNEISESH